MNLLPMKYVLSTLSVLLLSVYGFGQSSESQLPVMKTKNGVFKFPKSNHDGSVKSTVIWSSTFNNASEWDVSHDTAACDLDWTIGMDTCGGTFPLPTINSTSASDGWALLDSDKYGDTIQGAEIENSWLTTANAIDLTAYPYAQVQFEALYRRFDYERPFLVVGFGDGSGLASVVWPSLNPSTDISTMDNVFEVFPSFANNQMTGNPDLITINISSALAAATPTELQNVYVRLVWTGTWGYSWFVDDFKVIEQPLHDSELSRTHISGDRKFGVQYGKIPLTQVDNTWIIGSEVTNKGALAETNVNASIDYVSMSANDVWISIGPDTTVTLYDTIANVFSAGIHSGDYMVYSDDDTLNGAEFANNSIQRSIEVTSGANVIYAVDGVGLHAPADEKLGSLGTASFMINTPQTADALVLGNMYPIHSITEASGIRVLLAPGSAVGGELIAMVIDSADFMAADPDAMYESQPFYISNSDISNGYIDVFFEDEVSLDTGVYYIAAKVSSYANSVDVMVVDDQTVWQPEFASAMIISNSSIVYSNGNALGIQLLMGNDWGAGLLENKELGVSVYPNPTNGIVHIDNEQSSEMKILITDVKGTIITNEKLGMNKSVDLSGLSNGIYIFTFSDGLSKRTERIILNK